MYFKQKTIFMHNLNNLTPETISNLLKAIELHTSTSERLSTHRSTLDSLKQQLSVTERKIEAINTVGQMIGEVICELNSKNSDSKNTENNRNPYLTENKTKNKEMYSEFKTSRKFVVKTSMGPKYIVGQKPNLMDDEGESVNIKKGDRVALEITTLTIIKVLPREVDPVIFNTVNVNNSTNSDSGNSDSGNSNNNSNSSNNTNSTNNNTNTNTTTTIASKNSKKITENFKSIGGLSDQIRELREVIELPLTNPEVYKRIGVKPPKGVLLYGPPGTGKTLLAKAVAASLDVTFLKIVASSLIEKYIGESSRMIRELFSYARNNSPAVIFIDEIDAIGGKRTGDTNSCDREVQRTLMELLNQLDGFNELDRVKVIMATNRPDILDSALLRPGRLDRKIEVPLPNIVSRAEILKIYIPNYKDVDNFDAEAENSNNNNIDVQLLAKLTKGFNGADLRHLCTEAGYYAMRDDRDYIKEIDYIKGARKIGKAKKVEGSFDI